MNKKTVKPKDAFSRCKAKGGKVKFMVIDPKTKKKGNVCFLKGWGPVAESTK